MNYIVLNYNNKEEEFDLVKLEKNIAFLLWEKPENVSILRIKAILAILNEEFVYSLQAFDF